MPSDISWIDETREAVDRAGNLAKAEQELETLVEVEKDLDEALNDLALLQAATRHGHGTWWSGLEAPPDLWTELRSARKALGARQLRSFIRDLTSYRTQLRNAVKVAWQEHVASRAGNAGDLRELVQMLIDAPGLADVARRLDEALSRIVRLQTKLPDAGALQALDEAVELLDALEKHLPTAVKAFVSAAAHGGASLDLLDAEVRAWLVGNGTINNFRIVPGSPQGVRRG